MVTDDTYPKTIIHKARVARLATVDLECMPHLVPVVFVFDNDRNCYFIPIDEKIKRSRPENLKRVMNTKVINCNVIHYLLRESTTANRSILYFFTS